MLRSARLIALTLPLIACGPPSSSGDGNGGGGGGTPSTPSEISSAMINIMCGHMMRCGATRTLQAMAASSGRKAMDRSGCMEEFGGPGSHADRIKSALEAERVTFDAQNYQACKTAFENRACDSRAEIAACDQVIVGTVAAGEGCFVDEECQDGDNGETGYCTAAGDQCGACQMEPAAPGLGEDCPHGECAAGLTCDHQTCIETPARTVIGAGDACQTEGAVDPIGTCDRSGDLICVDSVCTATQFSSEAGTPCGANGMLCEGGLICPRPLDPGGDAQTCRAPAEIGEACLNQETDQVIACVADARCVMTNGPSRDWHCVALAADGEACDSPSECLSGHCEQHQCATEANPAGWEACP